MTLKPLPIGIQTFRDIIEGGYLYVDKTRQIYELVRYPKGVYFLARPRRFGKSLLISTLHEIFAGNRDLFAGLWLYNSPYEWQQHPVIRLDFSRNPVKTADELVQTLAWRLAHIAQEYGITLEGTALVQQLENLILQLASRQKAVILVDEYDKPILDNIENLTEAQQIQETLRQFYTVIKSMDAHIRFVFMTGISKFSKVGVFSGLNNLDDLSLSPKFSDMLGITSEEVMAYCAPYLKRQAGQEGIDLDTLVAQIRHWYDGFCFSARCVNVYNPFSLLLFLKHQHFANYWFESGTPTFLIKLLQSRQYDIQQLDRLEVNELAFSSYEIDRLEAVPLLFQTGYLTIKGYDPGSRLYTLAYPNYEVEHAFLQYLLGV